MPISSSQIRAARALAGWSQKDLAERAGLSPISVANIEIGESTPKLQTLEKIGLAFDFAGLEFLEQDGVRRKGMNISVLEGHDWFNKALEDVYTTLMDKPDAELIIDMADDRLSPPDIVGLYRKIRNAGIKMRQTVEEGNTYLLGPVAEYRWIPKSMFRNWVMLVYANKVVLCLSEENRALMVDNKNLADMERGKFNLIWSLLPTLNVESTAHARF